MENHLRRRVEPPQVSKMNQRSEYSDLLASLITKQIRYQEEEWQCKIESSIPTVVRFRIPAALIDSLIGVDDQRALLIAYRTRTEMVLPRRNQSSTFIISGYNEDICRALRMIEDIINEESHSSPYTFIPDPNMDQSDYILSNGPIREARYRPGREGMHRG
uniref:KH domain-containing protein n=1 Tax=Elaeophora elaphi TaxID=1147741 RepID=A0A0R3RKN9_9BILA